MGLPFRLASITRRQTSTVAWSPRSLAASRTIQAASSGLSGLGSSRFIAEPWRAAVPNVAVVMVVGPRSASRPSRRLRKKRAGAPKVERRVAGILARFVEFQNAARSLEIEAAELAFQ